MFWSTCTIRFLKREETATMAKPDQPDGKQKKKRYHYTLNFKARILRKWKANDGNISKTARENEVKRQTLQKWVKQEKEILEATRSRKYKSNKSRRLRKFAAKYPLLEDALLNYVKETRKAGATVNGKTLRRKALALYPTLYKHGSFKASKGFAWKFMRRNKLTERAVTGVGQKIPSDAPELCQEFLEDMKNISEKYDVILNADETPMYFDMPQNKTIDFEGVKTVKVKTTGYEKLRYTVLLTAGVQRIQKATETTPSKYRAFRLPPLIIFKNLTKPPKGKFPPGMRVLGTKGGSTTEHIMINEYIPKILSKRPGGFFSSQSTLLILDNATSHNTELVKECLTGKKIDTKLIHSGLTPLLQYLDTHVNKPFKGNVRERWEEWMTNGVAEFTKSGKRRRASYEMVCQWVHEEWRKVEAEHTLKGFRQNGYIHYDNDRDVLHSRLKETLGNGRVSEELVKEVDDFIKEFLEIDRDLQENVIVTDDEGADQESDEEDRDQAEMSDETDEESDGEDRDQAEMSDETDEESDGEDRYQAEMSDDEARESDVDVIGDIQAKMSDDEARESDVDVIGDIQAKMSDDEARESDVDVIGDIQAKMSDDEARESDVDVIGDIQAEMSDDAARESDVKDGESTVHHISEDEENTTNGEDKWISKSGYELGEVERNILSQDEWLNSNIMDAAQFLITRSFGTAYQSVLFCRNPSKFTPVDWDNLQLIHDGKSHWILTRSCNNQVQVYDSLRKSRVSSSTRNSIRCIYALYKNRDGIITVDVMNVQRQTDGVNCGLFAIAYAADILFSASPIYATYDVGQMRKHLIQCLQEEILRPFPKVTAAHSRQRKLVESIDVLMI